MATYNFSITLKSDKGYEISIDPAARYGYWEYPDGTEGGGLWFETMPDGTLELVDYDGIGVIHPSIVRALREAGYCLDGSFD